MSAGDSNIEQLRHREHDNMPSITQDAPREQRTAVPAFSYAQAAKGKVPSTPATPPLSMAKSDTSESSIKKDTNVEASTTSPDQKAAPGKQMISEGPKPQSSDIKATGEPSPIKNVTGNGTVEEPVSNVAPAAIASASEIASTSPSPHSGPTSVSSLPKDENSAPTVNGSAEPALDKQSQPSQNGSKHGDKANAANDSSQKMLEASWDDEKPETAMLKEAPPPPVNFWAQRMAQPAKVKPQQSNSIQIPKPVTLPNGVGSASEAARVTEAGGEPRKQESKKRSKGNTEDRPTMKEGGKSADGKAKSAEGRPVGSKCDRRSLTLAGNHKTHISPIAAPPPPPGDAISWPTPDSAVDEKKKSQNRNEKDDKEKTPTAKPHGKNQWQTVPFVPTVNFNTPMPTSRTRGGRGSSGAARESGARGRNSNGVDKSTTTGASPTHQTPGMANERGKPAIGSSSVTQSTQKPKRASSAGPTTVKEQRKAGDNSGAEKGRESGLTLTKGHQGKSGGTNEPRRQSATALNEGQAIASSAGRAPPREAANAPKRSQNADDTKHIQEYMTAGQAPPRNSDTERRSEGLAKLADSGKDVQPNQTVRDRGDGRQERGNRGGYRGRGGQSFNSYNAHLPNGPGFPVPTGQFQPPAGGLPSRSFSNHERLASQPQAPFYSSTPQHNRAYRSNSRSHSIQHSYGRFSQPSHAGPPHLANLQTDLANNFGYSFEPQPGSMSALPFNPYMVGPSLFGMVGVQMEYYFSVDNLCKDTYLRKNMNSQGFVPLELVAGFNRIKQLTSDTGMVRDVCFASSVIETRIAEDESIWLRKGVDWQQWVMDMDSRVSQARNDGPTFPTLPPFQAYGVSQTLNDGHEMSPKSRTASVPPDNIQYQSLDGAAAPVTQVVTIPTQHSNGMSPSHQAPLSAAVSEFSPSVRSATGRVFSSPDPYAQGTSTISDEEMDKLVITFRAKPADVTAPVLPPFHSASSRTFSNGSIDGNTISNELAKFAERQSGPTLNGDVPDR